MKPRALTIKIPEELHERLKMFALVNKTTVKHIMVEAAEAIMKRKRLPKANAAL